MTKKSSTVSKTIKKLAAKEENNQIIEQVRQLAWTGQHAKAIELATEALSKSDWQSDSSRADYQSALLDLRAESYIAQGNLDLAAKDAKAMVKVGRNAIPTHAQALNRLALIQMRRGELKAAVKSATS